MPRMESRKLQSSAFAWRIWLRARPCNGRGRCGRDSARASAAGSAPPQRRVAGVEQQMDRRSRVRHERVDVAPPTGRSFPCGGDSRASGPRRRGARRTPSSCAPKPGQSALPSRGRSDSGATRSPWMALELSAAMTIVAPAPFVIAMWPFAACEFVLGRALQQFGRIPAADERQAELARAWPSARRRRWAACGPSPCPTTPASRGFGEAGLERRVAADLLQVVVGPADRVGAEADASFQSPRRWICQRVLVSARAGADLAPASRPPARRRPTRRRRRRSSRRGRCR